MNVAALQKHLGDLADLLDLAGGANAAGELRAVQQGLAPFAAYKFADFAAFLKLALEISDEFRRTGQVPVPPPRPKAGGRKPAAARLTAEQARGMIRTLYDLAPTPAFPADRLEADLAAIKQLTVADLKAVADAAEAGGKAKGLRAKDPIIDAIRRAILERRAAPQRVTQ